MLFKNFFEIVEEVVPEDLLFSMVGVKHGGEEAGNLFRFGRQVDWFAWSRLRVSGSMCMPTFE